MVRLIFLTWGIFIWVNLNGQTDTTLTEYVFPTEVLPKYKYGTNEDLIRLITAQLDYSDENCANGITVLSFTVTEAGKVEFPIIRRSVCPEIDIQLLRVIYRYEFEPGYLLENPIRLDLFFPIKVRPKDFENE